MTLVLEIEEEYQRLIRLGEYSDAARTQIILTGKVLEIARRLEALEEMLSPLAEATRIVKDSKVVDEGKVAGLKLP